MTIEPKMDCNIKLSVLFKPSGKKKSLFGPDGKVNK